MAETPSWLIATERQLGRLAGLFAAVGGLAIFVLMGITVVGVFARYVLHDPIFGIGDLSMMTLTVVVAASVAYGAHNQAHVSVNVITWFAGRTVTRLTDLVARLLGLLIVAYASYGLFTKGSCGLPCGQITNNLSIVHTPFYYVLGLAMASYAALLAVHLLVGIVHWNGDDPNEVAD